MIRHYVLWNLKEEIQGDEKELRKNDIKTQLEGLLGKIPGLIKVTVEIARNKSCNREIALFTELESWEALESYQSSQAHLTVADNYVRPYTTDRICFDYEL